MNDKLNDIKEQLLIRTDNAWRNFKRFIRPAHPRFRKVYPRHKRHDLVETIHEINFALILDFWYEEVSLDIVNWNFTEEHKQFYEWLKGAVEWIEVTRPQKIKLMDHELNAALTKPRSLGYEAIYSTHDSLEKYVQEKDTEVLKAMMEYRSFFWT